MKRYVVFINYGAYEGWKIWLHTDSFNEAVAAREEAMGNGNSEVRIFTPVEIVTLERIDSRQERDEP